MPTPVDTELYNAVKQRANSIYSKPSAYKSGWIVRTYKSLGGQYREDNQPKKLKQWFKEKWTDIGDKDYPVYRPTVRVNKTTPLTAKEIDPKNLKKQIERKQKIKGKNLSPFLKKGLRKASR